MTAVGFERLYGIERGRRVELEGAPRGRLDLVFWGAWLRARVAWLSAREGRAGWGMGRFLEGCEVGRPRLGESLFPSSDRFVGGRG